MIVTAVRDFLAGTAAERVRIVAAVSGGADSTALLVALAELRGEGVEVVAAHVNHKLREADSDADEAFVRDLCERLGVELHVLDGTLDAVAVRDRGIEAAARERRYARLAEVRERTGAAFIATAHQKNDQAETVLMRLLSGSGIAGLRGIHPRRDDGLIRPLLGVTRAEIEAFLRARNIAPRHDRSNDDPRFLRNRVRSVLRELGGIDPLASVAAQARAIWPTLERAVDDAERQCARVSEEETRFTHLPEDEWLRGALLQRHIRRLDPAARDYDLARLAAEVATIRRADVTKTLELLREPRAAGDAVVLRRKRDAAAQPPLDLELTLTPASPAVLPGAGQTLFVAPRSEQSRPSGQLIQLPSGAPPLFTVRTRRPGDRFQPLGMLSSKKLKDFLIDRKIPAGVRDRLPLVVWNGEVVWVAGVEVSETVKLTSPAAGDVYELWLA